MYGRSAQVPDLVPTLTRGKHRNPRKGACFMELASYLAGERWTDHPRCTHPLLGYLARLVNDHTSDDGRGHLVELVPAVIGLTSDDPHVDLQIMLRSATAALPVVAAERQRTMAVAVLAGERALNELDGRPPASLDKRSRQVLAEVPDATRWARDFAGGLGPTTVRSIQRHGAPSTVRHAVTGIAHACVSDPDARLRDLLRGAIDDCARWAALSPQPTPTGTWPGTERSASRLVESGLAPTSDHDLG
jgi:hypothetical protein